MAVAAALATALGLSRYEAPPEKPARIVLEVDGLH
ncbi:hypothetical protein Poly30_35010 [Planctomycetes bacterium Poly30]|uniref:Uncharacterized protein n=1 Tax=Saltatorellus ferox TaxID=2528018 RepID=A0A518EV42_9BACT|nr:hypothetical protein Poly30_35010 [Planctomycetes bacterium Poly30]